MEQVRLAAERPPHGLGDARRPIVRVEHSLKGCEERGSFLPRDTGRTGGPRVVPRLEGILQVGGGADAQTAKSRAIGWLTLVAHPEAEMCLVHPVDQAVDRHPGPQDRVDQVHRGEVLHVLDAHLEQPRLVPHVETVQVAERIVALEAGDQRLERKSDQVVDRFDADLREHADHERDAELLLRRDGIGPDRVDRDDEERGTEHPSHGIQVSTRLQVLLEVAARQHLQRVEVRAQEREAKRLDGQHRPASQDQPTELQVHARDELGLKEQRPAGRDHDRRDQDG